MEHEYEVKISYYNDDATYVELTVVLTEERLARLIQFTDMLTEESGVSDE